MGWPPIRSFRKNNTIHQKSEAGRESLSSEVAGIYVKVSMDGAPYLRKIHLGSYKGYEQLLSALQTMFMITIGTFFHLTSVCLSVCRDRVGTEGAPRVLISKQVSIRKGKGMKGPSMPRHTKTRMATGCLSETSPGSKFPVLSCFQIWIIMILFSLMCGFVGFTGCSQQHARD